jgi:hypothetical protein
VGRGSPPESDERRRKEARHNRRPDRGWRRGPEATDRIASGEAAADRRTDDKLP